MLQTCNFSEELLIILKDFLIKAYKCLKHTVNIIMNLSRPAKTAIYGGAAVLAILFSLVITDAHIAYKVNYEGKVIATVSQKRSFSSAVNRIAEMVDGDVNGAVSKPMFSATIVRGDKLDGEAAIANAIIENSSKLVSGATFIVNGEKIAVVDAERLNSMLEARKNSYSVDSACTNEFVDSVNVEEGIFLLDDIRDISVVEETINSLGVKTSYTATTDKSVAYKTETQKTAEKVKGYTKVKVKGVNGVTRVTEDVVLLNGVEQSRTTVASEVVSAPVNEVVIVGTAKSSSSAKIAEAVNKLGFIFPLPSGTWKVSSYWGDGRGHKGIDLCANKNTAIFAVASGTVTKAGWNGDYGYCVKIDHGNGYSTLYAHANKVCVSVGQKVSQGDTIALVGNTGYSFGNHVHFEVYQGSTRINPAPFIGL